jgi:lipoprotein-anchoring transpeptidase ErfK/SrfK
MKWQHIGLAVGLAVGGIVSSQGAFAQTNDPGSNPAANPVPAASAAPAQVDTSEPMPQNTVGPKVQIHVDLTTQHMHVLFPDGSEADWAVASGRPGLDTPDGEFKPQWVDPDHKSKEYDSAPMPYAIFFDLKGHAIHGTYEKVFGRPVSHGCVRLPVADAQKLFKAVMVSGAEIDITGKAHRGGALWAQRHHIQDDSREYAAAPPAGFNEADQGYGSGYSYGYGRQAYGNPYAPPPPQPAPRQPQSFFGALFGQ